MYLIRSRGNSSCEELRQLDHDHRNEVQFIAEVKVRPRFRVFGCLLTSINTERVYRTMHYDYPAHQSSEQ